MHGKTRKWEFDLEKLENENLIKKKKFLTWKKRENHNLI